MLVVPRLMRVVVRLNRPRDHRRRQRRALLRLGAARRRRSGTRSRSGAFLAGALVAESGDEREAIEHLIEPVRDMFAAIFFVSVGMLIDPGPDRRALGERWSSSRCVVVVGKVARRVGGRVPHRPGRADLAMQAGMSLAQIGEFSFIIAGVGVSLGATRGFLYPVAVAVSAVTTLSTPWLIRASDPSRHVGRSRAAQAAADVRRALWGLGRGPARARPRERHGGRRSGGMARLLLIDAVLLAAIVIAHRRCGGRCAAGRWGAIVRLPRRSRGGAVAARPCARCPCGVGVIRNCTRAGA